MASATEGIRAAIAALEAQRGVLDDVTLAAALAPLHAALSAAAPTETTATATVSAETGSASAASEPMIRHVTVMFVDVVGSTAASRRLDPEDFHELIDGALRRFVAIVEAAGGRSLKFLGDGMLAAFGLSVAREDDAAAAVQAGLDILGATNDVREEVATAAEVGFAVRVGIDSGTVVAGGGIEGETSIRGSTVNLAARMEQSAPPGGLRISRATERFVRGVFETIEQPATVVKGLPDPITTYLVTKRAIEGSVLDIPARARPPLIGRTDEIAQMLAALARVQAGEGLQYVHVEAEAGVGKSRLLDEFVHRLAGEPTVPVVIAARANPRAAIQPYSLLRGLFSARLGLDDFAATDASRNTFISGVRPLVGDAELTAMLGHLVGFGDPAGDALSGDPQAVGTQGRRALAAWLEGVAAAAGEANAADVWSPHAGAIVILDDLQWGDTATVDLFSALAEHHHDLPVVLVAAARPTFTQGRPEWSATFTDPTVIHLGPLGAESAFELARAVLGGVERLPAEVQSAVESADGNPYFIGEILRMLIDDGVIRRDANGPWTVDFDQLGATHRPETLEALLQARVDGLTAPQRIALQQAAVIGYQFWDRALAAIDPTSMDSIDELATRDFVIEQDRSSLVGVAEWAFQHHLLQQFVYDSILRRDRVKLSRPCRRMARLLG